MSAENSPDDSSKAIKSVIQKWGLQPAHSDELEAVLEALAEKVSDLMQESATKFYHSLYRLDVNEEKVQQILSGRLLGPRKISKARALAELIFEREVQKAKSRGDLS